MTYRLRNIAIAIALAVLAAMLTSFYVRQQKEDIVEGQQPTAVWVATQDIGEGTAGSELASRLQREEVAKDAVAPGAIVQPKDLEGQVVNEKIYAGEQVSLLRFRAPSEQGVLAQLTGNLRAVAVPGEPQQLLSGTLKPGDHVDIVGSWKVPDVGQAPHYSRTFLRDILVLRPAQKQEDGKRLSADATDLSVMLALTDAQAQKLFWMMKNGDWSFELRPARDSTDSPESAEKAETILLDGLSPDQLRSLSASIKAALNERTTP
jgi:pilus assembly protein CpaB